MKIRWLTCGDVDVRDIHGGIQSQGKVVFVQQIPQIIHCTYICHIQLHLHLILKWRI